MYVLQNIQEKLRSNRFTQTVVNQKSELWFKSNCVQEPTDGKKCQFLIPSFGPREHCHGYDQWCQMIVYIRDNVP